MSAVCSPLSAVRCPPRCPLSVCPRFPPNRNMIHYPQRIVYLIYNVLIQRTASLSRDKNKVRTMRYSVTSRASPTISFLLTVVQVGVCHLEFAVVDWASAKPTKKFLQSLSIAIEKFEMYRKKTYAEVIIVIRIVCNPKTCWLLPVLYISIYSEKPHGLPLGIYSAFVVMLAVSECYIILLAGRNI